MEDTFSFIFEREQEWAIEGQREGDRERTQSRFCADSTEANVGLDPTNYDIMTWDGQLTEPPRRPSPEIW